MRELHLFAGAGGGILGGMLLGHVPVGAVEIDAYCRRVLEARQVDGSLPPFPIFEDVREFDGKPWRGRVDVVCGGFPCQPWSVAGKQLGADDPRHLWPEMARIIEEVRPRYVFAENVSLAAFEEPWRDLRRLGYRVPPAICVAASDVGAPHLRKRWWLLATDTDRHDLRHEPRGELRASGVVSSESQHDGGEEPMADAESDGPQERQRQDGQPNPRSIGQSGVDTAGAGSDDGNANGQGEPVVAVDDEAPRLPGVGNANGGRFSGRGTESEYGDIGATGQAAAWWATEPDVGRVANGVASRVDRLRAIGNGQVPQAAAQAFATLMELGGAR